MPQPDAAPQFSLDIDVQPAGAIVRCSGRLTGMAANTLRNEVKKLIEPKGRVVLDLTGVTHTDSMGLGAVVSLYVSAKSAGCRFELINLGDRIRQLFTMANFLSLFEAAGDGSFRIP